MVAARSKAKPHSPIDKCEAEISSLSREANALWRALSSCSKQGAAFSREMEKIEEQLLSAKKKLARSPTDFDLNEAIIYAKKASDELESLIPAAYGAAAASQSQYINGQFREIKSLLGKMESQALVMKKNSRKTRLPPGKIALLSFANHSKLCREKLGRLSKCLKQKDSREYNRLFSCISDADALSASADELLLKLSKSRLRGKIKAAKSEIIGFMRRAGAGRVFLDHKHLTLRAGHDRLTLSFSPEVKYCLEEIAPVSGWLEKIGKNSVLVGSFCQQDNGSLLKIGERAVVGSSIVYRECSVLLNYSAP
jgi:hypothetical protein